MEAPFHLANIGERIILTIFAFLEEFDRLLVSNPKLFLLFWYIIGFKFNDLDSIKFCFWWKVMVPHNAGLKKTPTVHHKS